MSIDVKKKLITKHNPDRVKCFILVATVDGVEGIHVGVPYTGNETDVDYNDCSAKLNEIET